MRGRAQHHWAGGGLRKATVRLALFACALACALLPDARAAWAAKSEYELRAAILCNLPRFVSWPDSAFDSAEAPVVIGVLGADPFGKHLAGAVQDRNGAEGRPLQLIAVESETDLARCHILFVTAEAQGQERVRLAALDRAPVLLVGETLGFVEAEGGSMALLLENNKIRIYLNKRESDEAGLSVRAQLLRLCQLIEGDRAR